MTSSSRSLWRYFVALLLASFVLNWLWEMAQMPAYVEMAGQKWSDTFSTCTTATVGDVAITLAIYGIGTLASSQVRWGMTGKWNVYVTGAVLGGIAAVVIEWQALASGRWTYAASMPIVPVLQVGLWPLLQLVILVPAAFSIAYWWQRRNQNAARP